MIELFENKNIIYTAIHIYKQHIEELKKENKELKNKNELYEEAIKLEQSNVKLLEKENKKLKSKIKDLKSKLEDGHYCNHALQNDHFPPKKPEFSYENFKKFGTFYNPNEI